MDKLHFDRTDYSVVARPRSRPRLLPAGAWLSPRLTGRLRLGGWELVANNPIHALAVRLIGLKLEPELLAHHPRKEPPHRVRLPSGASRDGRDGGPARPPQQCQHPRLFRMSPPVVLARHFAGQLRSVLKPARGLMDRARLLFDMPNSSQSCWRNIAPPSKPRGGQAALAGERSEPVRLGP